MLVLDNLKQEIGICYNLEEKCYYEFEYKSYMVCVGKIGLVEYKVNIFYGNLVVVSFKTHKMDLYKLIYSILQTDEILEIKE